MVQALIMIKPWQNSNGQYVLQKTIELISELIHTTLQSLAGSYR
jgi:hypothetical protein